MLIIDGSYGEGGGQVLRTALALAALTGTAVRVERIRAGRAEPGLRPQHLTSVRAAAAVCNAHVEGAELGSQELTFIPNAPPQAGNYVFDVTEAAPGGSAGAVSLILQTILIPLAYSGGETLLILRGGTHVPWAPSAFYVEHVFVPIIGRMGLRVHLNLVHWGFYPAGGGELHAKIAPVQHTLGPLELVARGELKRLWGTAVAMNLPAHIPQRMANRAQNVLSQAGFRPSVEARRLHGSGPGAGIFLCAEYEHARAGFAAYGRPGLPSEQVADMACEELIAHHRTQAPVDPYLADQMVLPMALAAGKSHLLTSRLSQHLLTNIWVVQQFVEIETVVNGDPGGPGEVLIRGLSWMRGGKGNG